MKTWRFNVGDMGNLGLPTADPFPPRNNKAGIFGRVILRRLQVDPDVAHPALGRCSNGRIIQSGQRIAVTAVGTHFQMLDS